MFFSYPKVLCILHKISIKWLLLIFSYVLSYGRSRNLVEKTFFFVFLRAESKLSGS